MYRIIYLGGTTMKKFLLALMILGAVSAVAATKSAPKSQYPDGTYRTHLDLIANNCWQGQEAFDVCISTDKEVMLFKLVELLALTSPDTFDFVNVLNLYNGNWYSIRGKSVPANVINKCKDLFLSFVELRKQEERSNTNE